MPSQGPNNPATAVNTVITGNPWLNPTRVFSSNNSRATCLIGLLDPEGDSSDGLDVTNFSFTIPGGSIITGIVAEDERSKTPAGGTITDLVIQLIKGGTPQGDDKATGASWPNTASEAYATYGTSSDLWGLTWTVGDINAANFGIRIRCVNPSFDAVAATGQVDHVRLTVHYDVGPPAGGHTLPLLGVG